MLFRVVWKILTEVSDMFAASIIRAANSSETSISIYMTAENKIPEDSHRHTRGRENPKYHQVHYFSVT
jgi:hypothetical protein